MVSAPVWDHQIKSWLKTTYPSEDSIILDIGAGKGKYGNLLKDQYKTIYAVEPWTDHVKSIESVYTKVFCVNIKDFDWETNRPFDIIILGDVLEHIKYEEAKAILNKCYQYSKEIVITIPYEYPQHILYNNELEIHLQPDLTPTNFLERYPKFHTLFSAYDKTAGFKGIGVYTKTNPDPKDVIIRNSVWK